MGNNTRTSTKIHTLDPIITESNILSHHNIKDNIVYELYDYGDDKCPYFHYFIEDNVVTGVWWDEDIIRFVKDYKQATGYSNYAKQANEICEYIKSSSAKSRRSYYDPKLNNIYHLSCASEGLIMISPYREQYQQMCSLPKRKKVGRKKLFQL